MSNTIQGLSAQNLFLLGQAYTSFLLDEIDQGIHLVLPVTVIGSRESLNETFRTLCDRFIPLNAAHDSRGEDYANTLRTWVQEIHGITLDEHRAISEDVIGHFEKWALHLDPAQLGRLLKEYVAESAHGSWEGFNRNDQIGISHLLEDMMRYYAMSIGDNPRYFLETNNINPL